MQQTKSHQLATRLLIPFMERSYVINGQNLKPMEFVEDLADYISNAVHSGEMDPKTVNLLRVLVPLRRSWQKLGLCKTCNENWAAPFDKTDQENINNFKRHSKEIMNALANTPIATEFRRFIEDFKKEIMVGKHRL